MDGSIADSTMLRMRSGLSRAYQPTANSTANDFFEELLRLPVASTVEVESKEPVDQADPTTLLDAPTSSGDPNQDPVADEAIEEEAKLPEDESSSLIGSCYTHWQSNRDYPVVPPPEGDQPLTSVPVPNSPETPAGNTQAPAIQELSVDSQTKAAVETTTGPEPQIVPDQVVEPVGPTTNQVTPASTLPSKDARRLRPRDEKSAEPSVPPQHQPQPTAKVTNDNQQSIEPDQKVIDANLVQPDQASVPAAQTLEPTRSANEDGRSPQREKWYEGRASESHSAVEQLLADQSGGQSNAEDAELQDQANWQELISQNTATTTDAASSTEVAASLPASSDLSQMTASLPSSGAMNTSIVANGAQEAAGAAASGTTGRATAATGTNGGVASNHSPLVRGSGAPTSQSSQRTKSTREDVESQQLTQQERVRLVQRVARSFSRLGPDGGQVTLKLSPPQLGVLNVSIKIEGQTMTARLQTETAAARDTILENLPVLRERLSEQGIEVEKFQVEVSSEDSTSSSQGQTSDTSSGGASGGRNESRNDSLDYRRLRRDEVPQPTRQREPGEELRLGGWPSRSLDVKA